MASHDAHAHGHHEDHHHHEEHFISKYIFSQDHKMIGKQFLMTAVFMGLVAMMLSILFRIQLAWPGESSDFLSFFLGEKWAPNGVLKEDMYLGLVTIHGTIMVFFVLTGGLSGTFSNLLIPLQLGARDMASGFMNMLSYWFFFASSIIMLFSVFIESGPASGGWTIYPPLSALEEAMPGSGLGMTLWLVSMSLFIVSSLLGSLNYIVTIINLRTKGMSMTRMPLTIWAFLVTAILGVLSFPVLFAAALLLIFDRSFGTSFYLSDIYIGGQALEHNGGSPILYEHLFWFLGHPEVYIVLLPALGITSEVIATNARKPIFGYRAMIASILGIAFLSFIVWGHHMFVSGMNLTLAAAFSVSTMVIAVPSAIKTFNWMGTVWRGSIEFTTPMLFALAFVSMFVIGGLSGIFMASTPVDLFIHNSYFIVAHIHYVLFGGSLFGAFAAIYFWYPKMFGRMMNETLGKIHFFATFLFFNLTFFPMHNLGLGGMMRRIADPTVYDHLRALQPMNVFVSWAAFGMGLATFIFLWNFIWSLRHGKPAGKNPWHSTTLEWTVPSPPGHGNFDKTPTVYNGPYEYSVPGMGKDFLPQDEKAPEGARLEVH